MTSFIDADAPFESEDLSLSDYIAILKRRWWVIAMCAALFALLAFIFSMLQTRVYEARAEVLLRTINNDALFPSLPFSQLDGVTRNVLAEQDWVASDKFDDAIADIGPSTDLTITAPNVNAGDRSQTGNSLVFVARGPSAVAAAEAANIGAQTYLAERHAEDVEDFQRTVQEQQDLVFQVQNELGILLEPITDLQERIAAATSESEKDVLRDRLDSQRDELAVERIRLEQELGSFEFELNQTEESARILSDPEISARLNREATTPSSPVSPNIRNNILLGLLVGIFGGLLAALLWENIDDKISSEEEAEALGYRVLASIPTDGEVVEGPRLFAREPGSTREMEAYRTARASLNFVTEGTLSSFLVTSALPSEGKSTTSANLAVALSMAGQRTLLIDADLRRPTAHKYFDLPNNVGLSAILRGDVEANDAMMVTPYGEMLALIPAGPPATFPSELLATPRLEQLISAAKEAFDVVIVDTPPLFLVADAALVVGAVDGIVLSVTTGMGTTNASKKSDARRLVAAIRRLRTPLLGIVLQGGGVGSYGYGYKYGYYESDTAPVDQQEGAVSTNGSAPSPEVARTNGAPQVAAPATFVGPGPASNGDIPPAPQAVDRHEGLWAEDRIDVGPRE